MVELTENDLKNYLCYMELHDVDDDEMANPLALAFLTKRGAIDIVDNDSGEISRITPKESKSLFGVTGMEAKKELLINKNTWFKVTTASGEMMVMLDERVDIFMGWLGGGIWY